MPDTLSQRMGKGPGEAFLLSAPIVLLVLVACRPSPAEFNLLYACLHRSLPTCVAAEEFAARVADRTGGRVHI